jgi:hypothetical protein
MPQESSPSRTPARVVEAPDEQTEDASVELPEVFEAEVASRPSVDPAYGETVRGLSERLRELQRPVNICRF